VTQREERRELEEGKGRKGSISSQAMGNILRRCFAGGGGDKR
jgi:hypothetical protein